MRFRRIAVTGASGYLGRLLVNRLAASEGVERVLGIDIRPMHGDIRPMFGIDNRPMRRELPSSVVFAERDVTAPLSDLLIEHGIEAVAHLAFVLQPDRNAERAGRVNVGGTASVLSACAAAGARHLLYMSSATVYGAHADNPPMLTEDAPLRPVRGFQYAESKVRVEALLAQFAMQHPDVGVCVLRSCPVLGIGADNFVARNLGRRVLVAAAGFDPPMQFLLDDDAAEIMACCLLDGIAGTYNVGGSGSIRWSEMAEIARRSLVRLPAPLLYAAMEISWRLRLQSSSSGSGLDFIRHPWVVSGERLEREHGLTARRSSRDAWEAFVSYGVTRRQWSATFSGESERIDKE